MMLYRYTSTRTQYLSYDPLVNKTNNLGYETEVVASIHVSNVLGTVAIVIHVLLVIPIMIFICNGQTVRQSVLSTIVLETLLSWTLLIQVMPSPA